MISVPFYLSFILIAIFCPLINGNIQRKRDFITRTTTKSYQNHRWDYSLSSYLPNILSRSSNMRQGSRLAVTDDQGDDDFSDDSANDDDQGNDDGNDDSNSDDDKTADDDQANDDGSQSDDGLTDDPGADDSLSDDEVLPQDDAQQGDDGDAASVVNTPQDDEPKDDDDDVESVPQTLPPLSWPIFNPTMAPATAPTLLSTTQSCVNQTDGTAISCPPTSTSEGGSIVSRGAAAEPTNTAAVTGITVAVIILLGLMTTFLLLRRRRRRQQLQNMYHQQTNDDEESLFDGSPIEAYSRGYKEGYEYHHPMSQKHNSMDNNDTVGLPDRVDLETTARQLGFINKSSIASYCDGFRDGHDAAHTESNA